MKIRYAKRTDLQRLTEIDNFYIENTNATFFVKPRTVDERVSWFEKYKESGPYRLIVCEDNGGVQGFAYSSRYRDHFSFNQTVETSIYLAPNVRRMRRQKGSIHQFYLDAKEVKLDKSMMNERGWLNQENSKPYRIRLVSSTASIIQKFCAIS